jgi:hypothetical protein
MLHPGDYPRAVSATWGAVRLRAPYSIEYRVTRSDGEVVWVHDEAAIERHGDSEIWLGTFTVIQPPPSAGWTPASLGPRIVASLGQADAQTALGALEGTEPERAALIGELQRSDDTAWLADLLIDLERDEPARRRVAGGLRMALSGGTR